MESSTTVPKSNKATPIYRDNAMDTCLQVSNLIVLLIALILAGVILSRMNALENECSMAIKHSPATVLQRMAVDAPSDLASMISDEQASFKRRAP